MAYGPAAYSKGEVFMEQLGYIVGAAVRDKILLEYYKQWRFKHPNANDFIRIAEKVSDMKLDWYKEYWINSTKTIDYKIDSLWEEGGITKVRIKRIGLMPMPVDLQLTFKDGSKEMHYVPLDLMYGEKASENATLPVKYMHHGNGHMKRILLKQKKNYLMLRSLKLIRLSEWQMLKEKIISWNRNGKRLKKLNPQRINS